MRPTWRKVYGQRTHSIVIDDMQRITLYDIQSLPPLSGINYVDFIQKLQRDILRKP